MDEHGDPQTFRPSSSKWRFVLFLCRTFAVFLEAGICKSFGVLIVEMVGRYNTNYMTMAFICSLTVTAQYLMSPLVQVLMNLFGARKVAVSGGLITGIAIIVSPYSPDLVILSVCFILTGFGMCMTMYPACILMNDYFSDRFLFWSSISNLGSLAGAFTLPPLVERSFEAYGYHGAFLIMGGLALNSVACGAGVRSREAVEGRRLVKPEPNIEPRKGVGLQQIRSNEPSPVMLDKVHVDNDNFDCIKRRNFTGMSLTLNELSVPEGNRDDDNDSITEVVSLHSENTTRLASDSLKSSKNPETSDDMSRFRDSQLQRAEASALLQEDVDGEGQGEEDEDEVIEPWQKPEENTPNEFKLLPIMISCLTSNVLFTEPMFTFLLIGALLYTSVYYAWLLFLVPHAMWLGIPASQAVLLSTMGGVAGIIGHVMFLVVDHWKYDIFIFFAAFIASSALVFFLDPLSSSFWFLGLTAILQGIFIFGADSLPTAIAKRTINNRENFASAFSMINISTSIGGLLGDMLSGYIYDVTASYRDVFCFLGGLNVVVVVIIVIYIARSRCTKP